MPVPSARSSGLDEDHLMELPIQTKANQSHHDHAKCWQLTGYGKVQYIVTVNVQKDR